MSAIEFKKLQSMVDEYAADCFDNIASTKSLVFTPDFGLIFQDKNQGFSLCEQLNQKAAGQVAYRLDAPRADWLWNDKHCPDDFRVKLLNDLVALRDDSDVLIRSKGESIRAVLSDQYTPFDNKPLVEMIGAALSEIPEAGVKVHRAEVGDDLRAYVLMNNITVADEPGKGTKQGNGGLHPGVYVSNGETGGRGLKVVGGLFRGSCSNGLIFGWKSETTFTIRHRWHSAEMIRSMVAEQLAIGLKLSEEAAKRFIASQEVSIPKSSLRALVDGWSKNYGITVEASTNWLASITANAIDYNRIDNPTLFDVVNGITYAAQERSSDEREIMERMGGDLLVDLMPRQQVLVAEEY